MASTNSTTHYELSQYIGTDKPTYLVDYNQDMGKIDAGIYAAKSEADTNSSAIGTLSNLTTTSKSNLVSAINEVDGLTDGIGTLSNLTTTAKTDLVSAINEVDGETAGIGTLADLTTSTKTNLVAAVNEVDSDIGTLSNLTTTAKTDLVAALNEVDGNLGDLTNLTTTAKTNLVTALNEVDGDVNNISSYLSLTDTRQLSNPAVSGTLSGANFNVALNSSGTYGKIYGGGTMTSISNGQSAIKYTNTGIKGVTTAFTITAAGIIQKQTGMDISNINLYIAPPTGTETSASITIRTNFSGTATFIIYLFPCIYYFSDFGDVD